MAKRKSKAKKMRTTGIIFSLISLCSLGIFSYFLLDLNVIPTKYLEIGYGIIGVIYLILFIIFFKKKCPKFLKIMAFILSFILSAIFIAGSVYLNTTNKFFDKLGVGEYDKITYSILVLKDSKFDNINDLKNKTIGLINDDNKNKVNEKILKKINYEKIENDNSNTLANNLLNNKIDALCLEQGYIGMLSEEINNFESNVKTIYSFNVFVKSHKGKSNIDTTKEAFIMYISGIDQYGSVKSVRGRSDVNQLAIINPKNHKILLLNTPRDYYVRLHNTTGLKDKLTHAGIYGIDKSIDTLNDIYDININYYFRVNFDSLIDLVDTIGGIDIDSDTDFIAFTDKSVHINKGINHLSGKEALAYARERHAYASGDRHRGENQQQIIKAIIEKMTSSTVLLSNYNQILNTLSGTFQTDMPSKNITDFLKMQLDKMPKWEIDDYSVDGNGSKQPTYSMPSTSLYVMIPNEETINTAKNKIKNILK